MTADDPKSLVQLVETCDKNQPPDAEGAKEPEVKLPKGREPTCQEIKAVMDWVMRSLEKRREEQLNGRPPGALYPTGTIHKGEDVSGKDVWDGHDKQMKQLRNRLATLRNRYRNKQPETKKPCDDPPDDPGLKKVNDAINRDNPTVEEWEKRNKTTVEEWIKSHPNLVKAAAVMGASYVVYRVLRFIPSLFPPLWPTIPENLAIP